MNGILDAIRTAFSTGRTRTASSTYATSVGWHRFGFELVPQSDGTVRLYILEQPSYGLNDSSLTETHRYYDDASRLHYVCIKDHLAPRNETDARDWADYWSQMTAIYIASGRPFS